MLNRRGAAQVKNDTGPRCEGILRAGREFPMPCPDRLRFRTPYPQFS